MRQNSSLLIKRIIISSLLLSLVLWIYVHYGALEYTLRNIPEFFRLVAEHIVLVILSMIAASSVGVTLGTLMSREKMKRVAPLIMAVVNLWQAVPSLGVIALAYGILPLIGLSGIGMLPALIALFFHAVAPIVRNTFTGIMSISDDIIEAAKGMGLTEREILFQIELPNALPVIMGGIRTSSAIIVGTAPLAFLIGGGGLGFWIFTGIALVDMGIMTSGAVPVALLAMAIDLLLSELEKVVVSKGIQKKLAQSAF